METKTDEWRQKQRQAHRNRQTEWGKKDENETETLINRKSEVMQKTNRKVIFSFITYLSLC